MTALEPGMDRPYFSICIPNYNYAHYIEETIRSVLAQDFQDLEIVVADNASTDGSAELVERLAAETGRVRLIRNQRNIGFAPNLERAARPARGRFMLMLSSDDVMLPGALATYKRILDALGDAAARAVIASAAQIIDGDRTTDRQVNLPPGFAFRPDPRLPADLPCGALPGREVLVRALETVTNPLPFCSTAYSRALYEKVEGYNGTWTVAPDFHFELKLLSEDPQVVFVDRPLFGYRVHQANQTAQIGARDAALKHEFDTYQLCLDYDPKIVEALGVDHHKMVKRMIETYYLKQGARYLVQSDRLRAFRLLMLSWALYPRQTATLPLAWSLGAALALGPAGPPLARAALKLGARAWFERPSP